MKLPFPLQFLAVFSLWLTCVPNGKAQTPVCTPSKLSLGGNICDLSQAFPNSGGTHAFRVAFAPGYESWTDTVDFDWIVRENATLQTGILTYSYRVLPNPTGQMRTGRIQVSSVSAVIHTIVQGADSSLTTLLNATTAPAVATECTPSSGGLSVEICDLSQQFPAHGGTHAVSIGLQGSNTNWNDYATYLWLDDPVWVVPVWANLSGNRVTYFYTVLPNPTAEPRSAEIWFNGGAKKHDVSQASGPVNPPPTVTDILDHVTNEDIATGPIAFTVGDVGTPLDSLVISATSSNTALVPNTSLIPGGSGASRTLTATPAPNQSGTATITVTVTDGGGLTASDSFLLTINAVNDPPVISSIANQSIAAGTATAVLPFTVSDVETAAGSLTVTQSSTNTALVPVGNIVLGGSGTYRSVTVTPATGQQGSSLITLTVNDGALSAVTSFLLTVAPPAATVKLASWGDNDRGQLGNNSTTDSDNPVILSFTGVLTGKTPVQVAAGEAHSLVLFTDGTLAAWGRNDEGQLGTGNFSNSLVPVLVPPAGALAGKTVTDIDAGRYHTIALCSDGTVACWGGGIYGVLGNNGNDNSSIPVQVVNSGVLAGKVVTHIAAGSNHNLALCSDGTIAAWGMNYDGALGINLIDCCRYTPVAVQRTGPLLGKTVTAISAGYHSLALCSDGTLAAWGDNQDGQLGNNSTNDSPVPVEVSRAGVLSTRTPTAITAGAYHCLASCSDGRVVAWGYNGARQLGDNTNINRSAPVLVNNTGVLSGKTVYAIAAGLYGSAAVCTDGTGAEWGDTHDPVPVAINFSGVLPGSTVLDVAAGSQFKLAIISAAPAPPTVSNISDQSTMEDLPMGPLGFTVNDDRSPLSSLTVTASSSNITLVPNANLTLSGSGQNRTLTVTPALHQSGTTTITVTVTDGDSMMASDSFVLTVNPVNDLPTISDITDKSLVEDTATSGISFTVGDIETAAGSLTLSAASTNPALIPAGNIVFGGSGASRTVTLTPAANQFGNSTITMTVSDGTGSSSDSFVLTVSAVNDLPTISDVPNQATNEDIPTAVLPVTIGDVETAPGSMTLTGASSNLTLVPVANIVFGGAATNRTVTVTPAPNQSGTATITLTVGDGTATVSDTFTLTVTAVNDPPAISDVPNQTVDEDTATTALPFVIGDVETAVGSLTLSKSSSNTTLVPSANIVLGGTGVNRTVTVTPAANQSGTATITLTVNDGTASRSDTFLLTVNAVNDPPTVSNITDKTTAEDTATAAIAFTVGDVETAAVSLTVSGASSNPALVLPAGIVFGGSGANRTVTVTPLPNQSGTATITVTASDGTASVSDTFLLTVTAVNDLPTISDVPSQTVNEDTPTAALPFTIGDVETAVDAMTLTGSSSNTTLVPTANIVFSGTGANRFVTVTPAANRSGSATITLAVSDGTATRSDTFTLTVTAVNDVPTISDVADRATNEDTTTAAIPFVIGDVETSASSLTVTRASSNTTLVPLTGVVLGGSGANRTVTITPAANQFGSTTITLTVSDGTATVSDSFVLTVNPVNDLPVISNVANLSTNEDTATAAIAFTITDLETPVADLTMTGGSSNTALVPLTGFAFGGSGGSRTVIVSPTLNQSGTSTITLTVSDGTATASDTFVLTVTAVNDAPTISDLADLTLIKNTASAAIPFTVGDVETAAASLTVTRTSSNTTLLPTTGVVLGGSGASRTITLTPAANQTGTATVTVTVSDGSLSRSDTFVVTVTNLLPLAAWKQAQFGANAGNESIAGDLANPDGDLLVNLLEYTLGGNPNSAASAPAPVSSVIGNRVALTFTRILANTDVTITVQGADSLSGPWTDLAQSVNGNAMSDVTAGAVVSETGAGTTRGVEVRDAFTLGQESHPQRFLQVKVSH